MVSTDLPSSADRPVDRPRASTRGRDPDRVPGCPRRAAPGFAEPGVCDVRKVWRQMLRDGTRVARCMARLMGLKASSGQGGEDHRHDNGHLSLDRVDRQLRGIGAKLAVAQRLQRPLRLAGLRRRDAHHLRRIVG